MKRDMYSGFISLYRKLEHSDTLPNKPIMLRSNSAQTVEMNSVHSTKSNKPGQCGNLLMQLTKNSIPLSLRNRSQLIGVSSVEVKGNHDNFAE